MQRMYRDVFPKKHTFLPVIHAEEKDQVERNMLIARDEGADGVFLINHSISALDLLRIYNGMRKRFPDTWIGLNFLGLERNAQAFRLVDLGYEGISGLWFDGSGTKEQDKNWKQLTWEMYLERRRHTWPGLIFWGTAFKGQPDVEDVGEAAVTATWYVDVVTTSGPGTGQPPGLEKIVKMKGAIGHSPFANASGITPENVDMFLPYVDCFLVATGIGKSFTELDPVKVRAFADKMER